MARTPEELLARKRESNRAYMARYRATPEGREKRLAKDRAWYAANKARRLAKNKLWRAKNMDKWRAYSRKARTGFTQDEWDSRFVEQNGLCAICRDGKAVDADHNHKTGQKRGLLCRRCNLALGFIEDRERHAKLTAYLEHWAANG